MVCLRLCCKNQMEPYVSKGLIKGKALYKCDKIIIIFCSCFEPLVLPAFSLFTHASYGDRRKPNSKKRGESNNIKWLPRDLGNGFNRLWISPAYQGGHSLTGLLGHHMRLCGMREATTQFSVGVLPHQRHGTAIIHFGKQPAVQEEIMSHRKGVFQHSILFWGRERGGSYGGREREGEVLKD